MSTKLGRLRKRKRDSQLEKMKREQVIASKRILPSSVVEFCREWLYYDPFAYNHPFLESRSHFIANCMARQTGKTFNGMAKLLYLAFKYPGSVILVTAPKYDQIKNIAFKALDQHLKRMRANDRDFYDMVVGDKNLLRTVIRFNNGSQILAEAAQPETIRGHTAKAVYLMECNFIRDDQDLYTAVLFTLNTTNGFLIAESTPWNTDSVFYKMYHDPAYEGFDKFMVPYEKAMPPNGPLSEEVVNMIKLQLAGDPARWKREMLCEWTEDTNTWLSTSLITLAQDNQLEYVDVDSGMVGEFYLGVDFGKKQDYSVVAILEASGGHRYLRHLKRFPLDTPYGAVIGYMKRIQDTWQRIRAIYADQTGVGEYIVEDMTKGGLRNVKGIMFTDVSKEAMATALKEAMRTAECPVCDYIGYVDGEKWQTTCPDGCRLDEDRPAGLRPLMHIPYDPDLFAELNLERFELRKSGKLLFSHPQGTNDDRFWAVALANYAVEMAPVPISKPIAKVI